MKKILIVDDSAFMRNILKDILADKSSMKEPVEIHEADGKTNAEKKLKTLKPDVILLDVVMRESESEGVEFLNGVKSYFDVGKIIIISSVGQHVILDECKKLGISAYLQKPFDPSEVVDAVNKIL